MAGIMSSIGNLFLNFTIFNFIEIIVYFSLIAFAFIMLKNNNARVVIVYYSIAFVATATVLIANKIYYPESNTAIYFFIANLMFVISVVVLFATEIKRIIWNRKRNANYSGFNKTANNDAESSIDEIIKAVQNMSKNDVGAIIILSNGNLPHGVLESGVFLDADISSQLIESVFFPKTPLHDGAMILYQNKIQAAGCFLPLAQEINMSKELGSRHRAGIGLTETVNVTAIIVSEESGVISIAKGGKIMRYVDTNTLRETLKLFYWQDMID